LNICGLGNFYLALLCAGFRRPNSKPKFSAESSSDDIRACSVKMWLVGSFTPIPVATKKFRARAFGHGGKIYMKFFVGESAKVRCVEMVPMSADLRHRNYCGVQACWGRPDYEANWPKELRITTGGKIFPLFARIEVPLLSKADFTDSQ